MRNIDARLRKLRGGDREQANRRAAAYSDRQTLICTHRLSTIHRLDQIIVLEHGRVVEKGHGPELIARGGICAKLYASGKFPTEVAH
jgi:ABC-type multidrug transport system fused ATPase/permease subunit